MRKLALLLSFILLIVPSYAQDAGRGIITESTVRDLDSELGSFNPLRCNDTACQWAVDRLFPHLLATDPETHYFGEGNAENHALALDWTISEDNQVYTFSLRDDALWSDGVVITAYDYFYSYLAIVSGQIDSPYRSALQEHIEGVVPLSDFQLAIIFKENNCDVLPLIDFPIAPAHVFDSEFAANAAASFSGGDVREEWAAWDDSFDYDFSFMSRHPFDKHPSATSGQFEFVEWLPRTYIRLKNGDLTYQLVPILNGDEKVNQLLNGDLTIYQSPLLDRMGDLEASENIQIYHEPSPLWANLAFNFADPQHPESAFDRHGEPIEQGQHTIFSDIRVRRAVQMAIDVQEVIDVALNGYGTVMAVDEVPFSWARDESLEPIAYDPDAAMDLLEEAGWLKVQGQQARLCIGCEYAEADSPLSISMGYNTLSHQAIAATIISQQLQRVGFSVNAYQMSFGEATQQRFDLYFDVWHPDYPSSPETYFQFTPENDVIGSGLNIGSYNNPELTEILTQARTVSGCNIDERRDLYFEAQRILQEEQPFVWLYAVDDVYAVHSSVQNWQPVAGMPLADLQNWVVFDTPTPDPSPKHY